MTSRQAKVRTGLFFFIALAISAGVPGKSPCQPSQVFYPAAGEMNVLSGDSYSARSAAIGSAFVGVADDPSALFSNPAGLVLLTNQEIDTTTNFWFADTFEETVVWGIPAGSWGGFSIAGNYLNYGTFEGRDELGSLTPSYNGDQWGLQAGWGLRIIQGVSLGLTLHGFQQNFDGHDTFYFDSHLGCLWAPDQNFRVGLDYANPVFTSSADSYDSNLDLGASYRIQMDPSVGLLTACSGSLESGAWDDLRVGWEISFSSQYFLRAGYEASLSPKGVGGLSGLTLGAGLVLGDLKLDYAFLPDGDLGTSQRFNIGYLFGAPASPASAFPGGTLGSAPELPQDADKNSLTVKFVLPPDFITQGDALMESGQYSDAAGLYRKAIQENDQNPQAWWALGNALCKLKQKNDAVPCFEKVLRLKPDNNLLREWLQKYKIQNP